MESGVFRLRLTSARQVRVPCSVFRVPRWVMRDLPSPDFGAASPAASLEFGAAGWRCDRVVRLAAAGQVGCRIWAVVARLRFIFLGGGSAILVFSDLGFRFSTDLGGAYRSGGVWRGSGWCDGATLGHTTPLYIVQRNKVCSSGNKNENKSEKIWRCVTGRWVFRAVLRLDLRCKSLEVPGLEVVRSGACNGGFLPRMPRIPQINEDSPILP